MTICFKSVSFFAVVYSLLFFLCSCAKRVDDGQKKLKLAENYYKLCMLEFSDKNSSGVTPEDCYKRALQYIQQAIAIFAAPEYVAVQATLLFRLNDFDASCKSFEWALRLAPEPRIRSNILNNYACLLAQMGKHERALQILGELEKDIAYFTPQAAIFNRGKIFFDQEDYNAASKEFLRAVQRAPDFLDARYYLAFSAFKLRNFSLARSEVKTILFLEPEHEGAAWLNQQLTHSF